MSELVGIRVAPSPENIVIRLHASDNIAIARVTISAGSTVRVGDLEITAAEDIPAGHKIALKNIRAGEQVIRYGQRIGPASRAIETGQRVHTHNLGFQEIEFAYEFPETDTPIVAPLANGPTFLGYVREDGRVGTRNYIAVVAASNCAAHTAELIAESFRGEQLPANIDGVVAFPHGEGCAMAIGPDTIQLQRTLAGDAGASERCGGDYSGPWLRNESDFALFGGSGAAFEPTGRHDFAGERRH